MKPKYLSRIIFFVLTIIIALVGFGYVGYLKSNKLDEEFKERLFSTIYQKETFTMDEVTNFEWGELYIFGPYTSREQMENEMGIKSERSFLDNVLPDDDIGLQDDSRHRLVFINNKEIVFKIDLERFDVDFLPIKKIINDDKTKLVVHKDQNNQYLIKKIE